MPHFLVGVDLGTSNSALSFVDAGEPRDRDVEIHTLNISQLVGAGDVGERTLLPSFLYSPGEREFAPEALQLPWKSKAPYIVGAFARDHGAKVPGRVVASAKSWLSHPGIDRHAATLPWSGASDVKKISPVDASTAILAHLREAWNHRIGKGAADRLQAQEICLTVPASFDAAARELTVEAARAAGFEQLTLLEEPQAAFYAWLADRGDAWRERVKVGDVVLVCDVGGGTTDFSLIAVSEASGDLSLQRVAVGEHILLGGDNMDLALAYSIAGDLPGGMDALDVGQRVGLTFACRAAKEAMFSDPKKASVPVAVLGRGSRVIGGSVKTELARERLNAVLTQGFFPECAPDTQPEMGRRLGLAEIGLPYAADAAITRHLARFLHMHKESIEAHSGSPHPTAVLFNGGVFAAEPLRQRVIAQLSEWGGAPISDLGAFGLELAVARGAAHYNRMRQVGGIRIRGGVSRAYYIGIESTAPAVPGLRPRLKALCVVPMGMEEGTEADVPGPEFGLVVGESAEFRFLSSTTRHDDQMGTMLESWTSDDVIELEPLVAEMAPDATHEPGQSVPVRLHTHVTEVGTLDLSCQAVRGAGNWKLQYNVRESATK